MVRKNDLVRLLFMQYYSIRLSPQVKCQQDVLRTDEQSAIGYHRRYPGQCPLVEKLAAADFRVFDSIRLGEDQFPVVAQDDQVPIGDHQGTLAKTTLVPLDLAGLEVDAAQPALAEAVEETLV